MIVLFYVVFVTLFLINVSYASDDQWIFTNRKRGMSQETFFSRTELADYESTTFRKDVLGIYAVKIAYTLRENLIYLFGYLMYQRQKDIGLNMRLFLKELKQGLQTNLIDVFELIPAIPQMATEELNQQMVTLLLSLDKITLKSFCTIKCSVGEWRRRVENSEMNLKDFVWHFGYNPILHGIVEVGDQKELARIRKISIKILKPIPITNGKQKKILEDFGASFLKIVREIKTKRFCLSEKLIGYLIAFYPWPLNNQNVEVALSQLKHYFTDENEDLLRCEVKIKDLEVLIDEPVKMLAKLLRDIENSWCDSNIRVAAAIVGSALKYDAMNRYYIYTFRQSIYIEPNAVQDLLYIVNREKYPLEIVLARNRVYKYLQKLIFYINRQKYVPYKYDTPEQALYALLNFILTSTPHTNLPIKQCLKAIRVYLVFYVKPVTIGYDLFINVIDGFLAPDLRDDIIHDMIEVKKMALDERQSITEILRTRPREKCMELMSCYLKIVAILKNDQRFGPEKAQYLILPASLLQRFLQGQITMKMHHAGGDIMSLLNVFNYNDYPREIVLAADKFRSYMKDGVHVLTKFDAGIHCTKQEVLLAYLSQVAKLGSINPELDSALQTMISSLDLITSFKKVIDLKIFSTVLGIWRTPETQEFILEELGNIEEFIADNEKNVETALSTMNVELCQDIFDCYKNIVEHLNGQDLPYVFLTFKSLSPELSLLNLGKLKPMTTQTLLKIVKNIQIFGGTENELEAAICYAHDSSQELDKQLVHVDCSQLEVLECFEKILERLKFSETKLKISILQFLLMPTTCDRTHCRWFPYEEKGSSILNPFLGYTAYLLNEYKNSLMSLHLKMDVSDIISYLNNDNINYILGNFKLQLTSSSVEKTSKFIKALSESNLVDKDVKNSINNVRMYMYANELPKRISIGNLLSLYDMFSKLISNDKLRCHMAQVVNRILRKKERVAQILSQIEVDCFTLEKCTDSFNILTDSAYSEQPGTYLIMELVKSDLCTPETCSWIKIPLNTKYVMVKKAIIRESETVGLNPKSPLIVQAQMGFIKDTVRSPNILKNLEKIGSEIVHADRKLQVYLHWLAKNKQTPKEKVLYYEAIEKYLTKGLLPAIINNYCIMFIMKVLKSETYDIMVSQDIEALLYHLYKESNTDKWLYKFRLRCDGLDECLHSIYSNIKRLGIGDKGIPLHIIRILTASHCSKVNCPYKIEISKEERDQFAENGLAFFEKLKHEISTPYHIQMDVDTLIKSFNENSVLKAIEFVMYQTKTDHYVNLLKFIIADRDSTTELKHAAENVYNFIIHGYTGSYLHFSNLVVIADDLKQSTTNEEVASQIDEIVEKLYYRRDAINEILEKLTVNCTTLQTCLNTLGFKMIKKSNNSIVHDILRLIEPELCLEEDAGCPWIQSSLSKNLENTRNRLVNEVKSILKTENLSLHLKLNLQDLHKLLLRDDISFGSSMMRRHAKRPGHGDDTLLMYLRNIGKNTLIRKGLEIPNQNIEDYLAHNMLPDVMDVHTFVAFGRLLMENVDDAEVVKEMKNAVDKVLEQKTNINKLMKNCKINCFTIKTCVESMLQCVKLDTAEGVHVRSVLMPSECDPSHCRWFPLESRETLMLTLEEIKHELRLLARNGSTPLIIGIEIRDLLPYLTLENVENYVTKIARGQREKSQLLLRHMSNKVKDIIIKRRVRNTYGYSSHAKVPFLSYFDLEGLSRVMVKNAQAVRLEETFLSFFEKHEIYSKELAKELENCNIGCLNLKSCLVNIKTCVEASNSSILHHLLKFLAPDVCTMELCPWIPEDLEIPDENLYPMETIQPKIFIIFYEDPDDDEILKHLILDLNNAEIAREIEKYTKLITETRMRITSLIIGTQTLNFYFNMIEVYKKMGDVSKSPVIDMSKNSEFVICVPFPNEDIRPLKFNVMKPGVRDSLMEIGKKQTSSSTKPKVTLFDYDGTKYNLHIDILNQNGLREIMKQTIDDINPINYWPMSFWPGLNDEETWKSVIITKNDLILRFLTDLAGVDYANKRTSIIIAKDGMLSMDYDPYKKKFRRKMDSMFLMVPILDPEEHSKYTFYVLDPSDKCCIPIFIDISKAKVIQALKTFNKKFPLNGTEPTFWVKTDEEGNSRFPVYINFHNKDMLDYLMGVNSKPELEEENQEEQIELETPPTTIAYVDDMTLSPTAPNLEPFETITPFVENTIPGNTEEGTEDEDTFIIVPEFTTTYPNSQDETTKETTSSTKAHKDIVTSNISNEQVTTEEEFIIIHEVTSNTPRIEASTDKVVEQFPNASIGQQITTEKELIMTYQTTSKISNALTTISEIQVTETTSKITNRPIATTRQQTTRIDTTTLKTEKQTSEKVPESSLFITSSQTSSFTEIPTTWFETTESKISSPETTTAKESSVSFEASETSTISSATSEITTAISEITTQTSPTSAAIDITSTTSELLSVTTQTQETSTLSSQAISLSEYTSFQTSKTDITTSKPELSSSVEYTVTITRTSPSEMVNTTFFESTFISELETSNVNTVGTTEGITAKTNSLSNPSTDLTSKKTELITVALPSSEGTLSTSRTPEVTTNISSSKTSNATTVVPDVTTNISILKTTEELINIPEVTTNIPSYTTIEVDKTTDEEEIIIIPEVTTNNPSHDTIAVNETTDEEDVILIPEVTTNIPPYNTIAVNETTGEEEVIIIPEVTTNIPSHNTIAVNETTGGEDVILIPEATTNIPPYNTIAVNETTGEEEVIIIPEVTTNIPSQNTIAVNETTDEEEVIVVPEVTTNIPSHNTIAVNETTGEEDVIIIPEVTTNIPSQNTIAVNETTDEEEVIMVPEITTNIPPHNTIAVNGTTGGEEVIIIPEVTTNVPSDNTIELDKTTEEEEILIIPEVTTNIPSHSTIAVNKTTDEEEVIIVPELTTDIPSHSTTAVNKATDEEEVIIVPEVTTNIPVPNDSETGKSTSEADVLIIPEVTTDFPENDVEVASQTENLVTTSIFEESPSSKFIPMETVEVVEEEEQQNGEEIITEPPDISTEEGLCDIVVIPIASTPAIVVLNLEDPAVVNTLKDLSGKLYYNGPSMILNVMDFNANVIPIEINSNDPVLIKMLITLSENTGIAFNPRNIETTEGKAIIVVSQENYYGKVEQIVFEDNASNKKLIQSLRASIDDQVETIPFISGGVDVPVPPGLTVLAQKLPIPALSSVNYVPCQNRIEREFVLPVYENDKCYYYSFDTTQSETIEKLKKLSDNTLRNGTIITVVDSEHKQFHITLDLTHKDIISALSELSTRRELQGDTDGAIMAIVASDKASVINTFLLDLSNNKVLHGLMEMSKNINPSSITKGIVHYRQPSGKVITIIVDYNTYDFKKLKRLQQYTSIDLKPVFLPNFESKIPYMSFMIFDHDKVKRSVVLNLNDDVVLRRLERYSKSSSYNLPINIRLRHNVLYRFFLNRTDPRTINGIIELTKRCPAISVPTQTVQRDGSYPIIIPLRVTSKITVVELGTRKSDVMKTLKDLETDVSLTVPSMVVLNPKNIAEEIRIDLSNQEKFDILLGHASNFKVEIMPQTVIVIWLPKYGFTLIDCSKNIVVKALIKMSVTVSTHKNLETIVFQDSNGMLHLINLDLKDKEVIYKLLVMSKLTSETRNPITIMVRPLQKIIIFTLLNAAKSVKPVILDLTNKEVINQLIAISNPRKGVSLEIIDEKKNTLVIRVDVSDPRVIRILLELTKLAKSLPPFVFPPYRDDFQDLKIPLKDMKTNMSTLHICNMSDPVVVDQFLKIPGKNTKGFFPGTAFPIVNLEKEAVVAFLNLKDAIVIKKVRQICPSKITVVDPGKILLLVLVNADSKHEYVFINTNNETIFGRLKEISSNSYDAPDLQKYQIIDQEGNACTIKINLRDDDVQNKLKELSKLASSSGSGNFLIADQDKQLLVIVIANYTKPIIIPIDQVQEVESEINQIKQLVEDGKISEAEQIQQNLPQDFHDVNIVPGSSLTKGKVEVACLDGEDRSLKLTLNLKKTNVTRAIKEAARFSDKSKPSLIIKLIRKGDTVSYMLDNTNPKVCNLLKRYCDYYYFCAKENSLLILKVLGPKKKNVMIILDLSIQKVVKELRALSMSTSLKNITKVGIYMTQRYIIPFKLNTSDRKVAEKLLALADLTPAPLLPTSVVNPYNRIPYIAFTLKFKKSRKKHFVLDLGNYMSRIKLDGVTSGKPMRPYLISYREANGKEKKWLLDISVSKTMRVLKNITSTPSMTNDALLSVPQRYAVLVDKAVIPCEDAKGNAIYRVLDLSSRKVKVKLRIMHRNTAKTTPAMVFYTKDSNQLTQAWRINVKEYDRIANTTPVQARKVYLHRNAVLIITFLNDEKKVQPIILDLFRKDVDVALKSLSDNTLNSSPYSMMIVDTVKYVDTMIRLDLNNHTLQKILLELQNTTRHPLVPIKIRSPAKTTNLIIFTVKGNSNETVPILLDINNPQVTAELKKISRPGDEDAFPINLSGYNTQSNYVYINVYRRKTREKLKKITRFCPLFKAPVTLQNHEMKQIPFNDDDGQEASLKINTTDPIVISKLMRLSKNTPNDKANLWFNILDNYGNILTIQLDRNSGTTRMELMKLYESIITPEGPPITPPTGPQPLLTITIKESQCYTFFTLDPNINPVITALKKVSSDHNKGYHVRKLKVTDKDMRNFVAYIDFTKSDVLKRLREASQLSDIQTSPPIIIPATGPEPLIHFLARRSKNHILSATVDLNDKKVVKALKKVSLSERTGAYVLSDNIYLNMSDPKTIKVLEGITEKSDIKLVPNSGKLPLVQFNNARLDICNPTVVNELILLDDKHSEKQDLIQIFVNDQNGLKKIVKLDLNDLKVQDKIVEMKSLTRLPSVNIQTSRWSKEVEILPVTIIQRLAPHPIILAQHPSLGKITVDINDRNTLEELTSIKSNSNNKNSYIEIESDGTDIKRIDFDVDDKQVHNVVKQLYLKSNVTFDMNSGCWFPTLRFKKKIGGDLVLDLANRTILKILESFPISDNPNQYILQVPSIKGFKNLYVDPDDSELEKRLWDGTFVNDQDTDERKLSWVTFELKYGREIRKYTVDINNSEMMKRLERYSQHFKVYARPKPTVIPKINKKFYFDISCPKCRNFLENVTFQMTGTSPEIKPVTKKIFHMLKFFNNYGKTSQITIDLSNLDVMKGLRRLSDMYAVGLKEMKTELQMIDGTKEEFIFDIGNVKTINNLRCLEKISIFGTECVLEELYKAKQLPMKNEIFNFDIVTRELGKLKIFVDLRNSKIFKNLLDISGMVKPGRNESTLALKNPMDGNTYVLQYDSTDPQIVYKLLTLTKLSMGRYPLHLADEEIRDKLKLSAYLTIEVGYRKETFPLTLDTREYRSEGPNNVIINLSKFGMLVIERLDTNNTLKLDLNQRVVMETLLSVTVPTVIIQNIKNVDLYTIFIVKRRDTIGMVVLNLSEKETVLAFLKIVAKYNSRSSSSTVEIKDSNGQYVTVGVDMKNMEFLYDISQLSSYKQHLIIDARKVPYLVVCSPVESFGVKIKMTTNNIKRLTKLSRGSQLLMLTVQASNLRFYSIKIDFYNPQLLKSWSKLADMSWTDPRRTDSVFIAYSHEDNHPNGIYLDLENPNVIQTIEALHEKYLPDEHLTVIKYLSDRSYFTYLTLNLHNQIAFDILKSISMDIQGHDVIRMNVSKLKEDKRRLNDKVPKQCYKANSMQSLRRLFYKYGCVLDKFNDFKSYS